MNQSPTWSDDHARLHKTLRQRQLLNKDSHLLIAVSGGQDSLCLLKLLIDLQKKWNWTLAVAHCDHRWSTDNGISDRVEHIAQRWQLPFYLKIAEVVTETEAAAREWRYQALVDIATEIGFKQILTGHTQSDRAETMLYNLMRGAGTDGLQALSWQRALTSTITLIRPLLEFSRQDTHHFCQKWNLPVWEDVANQNLKYARNRIRCELIPYMKTHFNPQVETSLAQTAEILRADVEYLEELAKEYYDQAISLKDSAINRKSLKDIPLSLQRLVLRRFLQSFLPTMPNFEQVEMLVSLINAPNRSRTAMLPCSVIAEAKGEWISLLFDSQTTNQE